jgi:CRP-like cAMP-binding protein
MSIEDDITFMERISLLGLLGRAALRVLAIGSETRHIPAGDVLFVAGEPADAGYVVQTGSFSLLPDGAAGATAETVVTRGTLLGELALIAETVRPATATALEPATVIRISRTLFLRMLDGYPDAARKLRDGLMARSDQDARDIARARAAFAKVDGEA